jgi:hypothetical protein
LLPRLPPELLRLPKLPPLLRLPIEPPLRLLPIELLWLLPIELLRLLFIELLLIELLRPKLPELVLLLLRLSTEVERLGVDIPLVLEPILLLSVPVLRISLGNV